MNQKTNVLIIVLLIGAILIGLYNIHNTSQVSLDTKEYYDRIDSLQTKIDSITTINKELDNRLVKIDTNIIEITKEISVVDNRITEIKVQTNEKINSVDAFDDSELQKFFTDRYQ